MLQSSYVNPRDVFQEPDTLLVPNTSSLSNPSGFNNFVQPPPPLTSDGTSWSDSNESAAIPAAPAALRTSLGVKDPKSQLDITTLEDDSLNWRT